MDEQDGGEVVPVHRDAVPLHLVLEPDRLHPAADEHRAQVRHLRRRHPGLRALRRDREPLDPARARARRVHLLQRRGHPRQGRRRLPQEPHPRGRRRAAWRRSIFVLEFMSNFMRLHLALRTTLRQHPRRPPDHPVHVRRASPCCSGIAALGCDHAAVRRRALPLRGRPGRHACRRSSSPPSLPSTSAAPSPRATITRSPPVLAPRFTHHRLRRRRTIGVRRPARRSPSASAAASAPSAPASASASSSARSSSR